MIWLNRLAQTVTTDDRTWLMHRIMSMNIKGTFAYLYPRVFALVWKKICSADWRNHLCWVFSIPWMNRRFHHLWFVVHTNVFPKRELMLLVRGDYSFDDVFWSNNHWLENGLVMYIWLGTQVNPLFVQSLFGLQTAAHIQPEKVKLISSMTVLFSLFTHSISF